MSSHDDDFKISADLIKPSNNKNNMYALSWRRRQDILQSDQT